MLIFFLFHLTCISVPFVEDLVVALLHTANTKNFLRESSNLPSYETPKKVASSTFSVQSAKVYWFKLTLNMWPMWKKLETSQMKNYYCIERAKINSIIK